MYRILFMCSCLVYILQVNSTLTKVTRAARSTPVSEPDHCMQNLVPRLGAVKNGAVVSGGYTAPLSFHVNLHA